MGQILLQGFLVGLAYVAPIGMQNAYVINSAAKLKRSKALLVAIITIFFDVTLALGCFFGIGLLIDQFTFLKTALTIFGSIAVCYIGFTLIRSKSDGIADSEIKKSMLATVVTCFTVTWLNPQALVDGTMLLSGFNASLGQEEGYMFISGVALASTTWFISLAMLVYNFKNKMTPKVLTTINRACGVIIIFFGIKMGISLL